MQKCYSLTNGLEVSATANEFHFDGKQTRLRNSRSVCQRNYEVSPEIAS